MKVRAYLGNFLAFTDWKQVVDLTKAAKPVEESAVETIAWKRAPDAADVQQPFGLVWQGKIVQLRSGAARFGIAGNRTALMLDGNVELPVGDGNRTVDVWLEKGPHDLTIFSAIATGGQGASAAWAKAESSDGGQVVLVPLRDRLRSRPPEAKLEPAEQPACHRARHRARHRGGQAEQENGAIRRRGRQRRPAPGQLEVAEDVAQWDFDVAEPGVYDVIVNCAHWRHGGQFQRGVRQASLAGDRAEHRRLG